MNRRLSLGGLEGVVAESHSQVLPAWKDFVESEGRPAVSMCIDRRHDIEDGFCSFGHYELRQQEQGKSPSFEDYVSRCLKPGMVLVPAFYYGLLRSSYCCIPRSPVVHRLSGLVAAHDPESVVVKGLFTPETSSDICTPQMISELWGTTDRIIYDFNLGALMGRDLDSAFASLYFRLRMLPRPDYISVARPGNGHDRKKAVILENQLCRLLANVYR